MISRLGAPGKRKKGLKIKKENRKSRKREKGEKIADPKQGALAYGDPPLVASLLTPPAQNLKTSSEWKTSNQMRKAKT